jgi:acyl-[acyl carrier protein]--UDP-N-acetylglucosamine O-acyltransferase
LIHSNAELGNNVSIGPYSIVEEGVQIGDKYKNRTNKKKA